MALAPLVHRMLQRLYGIDAREVLNSGQAPAGDRKVAAELLGAVRGLQETAFDTTRPGLVDYARLAGSTAFAEYRGCAARLAGFDPSVLTDRPERLAFWINLYNALVIDAVIAYGVRESIQEVRSFFWRAAYRVGGQRYSANDIEHGILRANRGHPVIPGPHFAELDPRRAHVVEPMDLRIHFALVCASRSCPPIGVYDAEGIHRQLDLAAHNFVNQGGVEVDPKTGSVALSRIFFWYRRDFGGARGAIEFILPYRDQGPAKAYLTQKRRGLRIRYQPYDWSLNR